MFRQAIARSAILRNWRPRAIDERPPAHRCEVVVEDVRGVDESLEPTHCASRVTLTPWRPARRSVTSAGSRRSSRSPAKHGFGYFFETHRVTRRAPVPTPRGARRRPLAARRAPAGDARRAGPDLRQVRAGALDAPRRPAAGHHRRAPRPPGRRQAVPVRAGRGDRDRGARAHGRAAVPRVRADAGRVGLDRPGAPGRAPEREARGGEGAATRRAEADRRRPRADDAGREARARAGEGARVRRPHGARRRVLAPDPPRARLPARGAQRRGVPPQLRGPPARRRAAGLLELHALARAHARAARGAAAGRHRRGRLHGRGAPPPRVPDHRDVDDDDLPPRLLPRRPAPGEHHGARRPTGSGSSTSAPSASSPTRTCRRRPASSSTRRPRTWTRCRSASPTSASSTRRSARRSSAPSCARSTTATTVRASPRSTRCR